MPAVIQTPDHRGSASPGQPKTPSNPERKPHAGRVAGRALRRLIARDLAGNERGTPGEQLSVLTAAEKASQGSVGGMWIQIDSSVQRWPHTP